jgi:hypothetical protein
LLKGIKIYRNDPFRFDFILDKGEVSITDQQVRVDSSRLIKYFLAALTIPETDLWVNLSPYEKDRIVPEAFGRTEMGRDLLLQDYILKQITASVMNPEGEIGKSFWKKVYAETLSRYGTTDVPVGTLNKVWIVPEKAMVYENKDSALVMASRLKVMLDEDYRALENGATVKDHTGMPASNNLGADIVRGVVLPVLEKEVNEGKNFAALRQVYYSLILATWYKRKVNDSVLGQAYVDRQKTAGINIPDKNEKEMIWGQYVEAFKRGSYNLIKEEYDEVSQEIIPRKYFSGGFDAAMISGIVQYADRPDLLSTRGLDRVSVELKVLPGLKDASMSVPLKETFRNLLTNFIRGSLMSDEITDVIVEQEAGESAFVFTVRLFLGNEGCASVVTIGVDLARKMINHFTMADDRFDRQRKTASFRREYGVSLVALFLIAVNETLRSQGLIDDNLQLLQSPMVRSGVFQFFDFLYTLWKTPSAPSFYNDERSEYVRLPLTDLDWGKIRGTLLSGDKDFEKGALGASKADPAMMQQGGINFDPQWLEVGIKDGGDGVHFDIDPVALQRMKNSSGVTPVIIGVRSLENLPEFMGINPR